MKVFYLYISLLSSCFPAGGGCLSRAVQNAASHSYRIEKYRPGGSKPGPGGVKFQFCVFPGGGRLRRWKRDPGWSCRVGKPGWTAAPRGPDSDAPDSRPALAVEVWVGRDRGSSRRSKQTGEKGGPRRLELPLSSASKAGRRWGGGAGRRAAAPAPQRGEKVRQRRSGHAAASERSP